MDIADALLALKMLKPKLTIPMHYNTFPLIQCDPFAFAQGAKELGFEVGILEAGEILDS
jgi:L-ascorbate metabolism protein UlaG (beta-lactamase superfamily)